MKLFIYLLAPLVLANIFHMLIVNKNFLSSLQIPLSEKLFGKNKTLRAFLLLPTMTSLLQVALSQLVDPSLPLPPLLLGACLGLIYLASELPNSFIKRRLNIPSGQTRSKWNLFFDKTDSPLGVCIFLVFIEALSPVSVVYFFVLCLGVNFAMSLFLVKTNFKEGL